jgi:thiamine biosynthesis protein ThiI
MEECLLIHYSEVGLKGGNRGFFEATLQRSIELALGPLEPGRLERLRGRLVLGLTADVDRELLQQKLASVPGVAYFGWALRVPQTIEAIESAALEHMSQPPAYRTFRVRTRRAAKSFPMSSNEISAAVGAAIQARSGAGVDLRAAEATLRIELVDQEAYVYRRRVEGPRGLPVGTGGRVVALLSAGIDSPVAAYRMITRGCRVILVHFHSQPYTSKASAENAAELAGLLSRYQGPARLYLVPLAPLQQQIVALTPPRLRVLLYRRMMLRIGAAIAEREGALALVTGDSLGQVSSQTLVNLAAVGAATGIMILRPLVGVDKQAITREAEAIGTYPISIQPYSDCCSYLMPRRPETAASPRDLAAAEALLGHLEPLIQSALEAAELRRIKPVWPGGGWGVPDCESDSL